MTNYDRGYATERAGVLFFRELGYVVLRSGGSRTPVDFVALRAGQPPLFLQSKRGRKMSVAEWCKLASVADDAGARPLLWTGRERGVPMIYEHNSHAWQRVPLSELGATTEVSGE